MLGSVLREGEGIHLWLQLPGSTEPRAFAIPWSRDTAEQLQQALRDAQKGETELRMRLPFEPSLDDRKPKFYALPQPALPPKDVTDPPPEIYQHPRQEA